MTPPLTVQEVWETLGLDGQPWESDPLDYSDADQRSKSIMLNDQRWVVLLRRVEP